MPSFHDMAIDLLNEVKSAKDMHQKREILAQIKEIIIYRDPSIISDIISDVLDLILTDKSVPFTKDLTQLAGLALEKNISIVPNVVSLFNYICNDNFDPLLNLVAIQLSKFYSKILMFIVKMPPKTKAQISTGHVDPKLVWDELRNTTKKIIETISSKRSESLRIESLRCVEDMILFGLPPPPLSSDPRIAARQKALMIKESSSLNADEIPLHHPFISRDELEQESEALFSQFLQWSTKGGPQNFQFSPSLMSQLGQSISVIATSRPVKSSMSAVALTALLKGSSCQLMTKLYRDNLSQKIQNLIRSSVSSTDTDGFMAKLKTSLPNLTLLSTVNDDNTNVTGVKRNINGDDENDSNENLAEKDAALLRAKAIAAIDAAENDIKLKEAKLSQEGAIINNATISIISDASLNRSSSSGANPIEQVDTELSLELGEFPEISNNLSLATLSTNASSTLVLTSTTSEIYRDLATTTLQKMLESFSEIKIYGNKIKLSHIKVSMRMVISLSLNELYTNNLTSKVFIISSLSTNGSKFNIGVPMDVDIPRPFWLALSFILTVHREEYNSALARLRDSKKGKHNKDHNVKSTLEDKVDMLLLLMNELYTYINDESDEKINMLYESSCLIIISRILQNLHLRSLAKNIIMGLPFIPLSSLRLLNLLTNTGSRAVASAKVVNRKGKYNETEKNRGTRTEARELLSNLIFSSNENTATSSLNYLLWSTVSEDFETRNKSINELIQKVIPHSDWAYQEISLFSVHVIISLLGIDEMKARFEERKLNKNANKIESNESKVDNKMSVFENEERNNSECEIDVLTSKELNNGEVEEINENLTLEYSIDNYDEGVKFEGNFSIISPSLLANPLLVTAHVKKCLNLLLQMCVEYPELIILLMDIYGSALASSLLVIKKQKEDDNNNKIETDQEITSDKNENVKEEENIYSIICKVITDELSIVISAVSSRHSTDEIFKIIVDSDPVALPLLEHILNLLHNNLHMPAKPKLINMVVEFAKSREQTVTDIDIIGIVKEEKETMEVDEMADNKSSISELESSIIVEKETDIESVININTIKLFIPLIGGFTSQVVINLLPLIIQSLIDEPIDNVKKTFTQPVIDKLKKTFSRIVQTRPPPLSKVALLTQLHRIDENSIERAIMVQCIKTCLDNKEEYTSEIMKEVLTILMNDDQPPEQFMRTVIVSSQAYPDVKKFTLNKLVPCLIKKKLWQTNSYLKGISNIVHFLIKVSKDYAIAELTLKCLLGLPGTQLEYILKNAPKSAPVVTTQLAILLKSLSATDKEDCISGKFAEINTDADYTINDEKKKKIIKDLSVK